MEFGVLQKDYREQKSAEQARYHEAARLDPSLIPRGQIFKDVCKDYKVVILRDPLMEEDVTNVY